MNYREKLVQEFGLEIVEDDEKTWEERGYRVNYDTGYLERIA